MADSHLLHLPRPNPASSPGASDVNGAIDTTTLAAHDFDVDNRTGFMPPHPPLAPLSFPWSQWEDILSAAQDMRLQLGSLDSDNEDEEKKKSAMWRESVQRMDLLSTRDLSHSELILRRAHHVLTWILHFHVHTHDESVMTIVIPRSLTIPLLRVCAQLQLPPVLTYSDNVLYNWEFDSSLDDDTIVPTPETPLRCQTLFTHTRTESVFYLVSARIELIGVHALDLMRATMDELFVGDDIAARRITEYLKALQGVIGQMKTELLSMKEQGCDPETFYHRVRPWLRGCEDHHQWIFDGLDDAMEAMDGDEEEEEEEIWKPEELSGPSAGQSSLVHALDIFLGVDKWSHSVGPGPSSFLTRMQQYMPRHHRHFLLHLATWSSTKTHLREFVISHYSLAKDLVQAYNGAIMALKEFRDAHLIVVALFIVGPAARASKTGQETSMRGTGGTDIVQFLKTVRDQTRYAVL